MTVDTPGHKKPTEQLVSNIFPLVIAYQAPYWPHHYIPDLIVLEAFAA